jgi:YD repeat-containing protein
MKNSPPLHRWLRRILLVILAMVIAVFVAVYAGPMSSGALFLLLPSGEARVDHDLPDSYTPLHKGYIDLGTGLYVREDEDLIVRGTPPLILRRTYLSRYHEPLEFGVATTHPGEIYLRGNGARFQWIELILADGARVRFDRTSSGSSFLNAMFDHRSSPDEWMNARVGWTGGGWALRRADGHLMRFQACGPGIRSVCSILSERDRDGHTIQYRRNSSGRLERMEAAGDRWIAFDYDGQNRIIRAYDATGGEVGYEYDDRGRLAIVKASAGTVRRYTYTDRNEMATIEDVGTSIENIYDENGRCIRQLNYFPNEAEPYPFDFSYRIEGDRIVETESRRSDRTVSRYTFNESRYTTAETWMRDGIPPAIFTYERDSTTNVVTSLTVTCPDRTGKPLRHSSLVRSGEEDAIKWDLVRTHCSWSGRRWRNAQ